MRDNCVQVAKKLPVIYYYIIIPTTYNFSFYDIVVEIVIYY